MGLSDFAGFGIRGYRSFGHETDIAIFGPIEKLHLVVGRNNVGKSNALHFVADVLTSLKDKNATGSFSELYSGGSDLPRRWSKDQLRIVTIGLYLTDAVREKLHFSDEAVGSWLGTNAYSKGFPNTVWFDLEVFPTDLARNFEIRLSLEQAERAAAENSAFRVERLGEISRTLTSGSSSDPRHNLQSLLNIFRPWMWVPPVSWVDAIRQITAEESENYLKNGAGLIPQLARLERPKIATFDEDSKRFEALEEFVRDVLQDPEAGIQIPNDRATIHVRTARGVMELDKVGTGIGEVILLAAVASTNQGRLVCIEEPEAHLHPTLQKKLITYLAQKTDNHYLISTHSAQLLNAEVSSITHIEMAGDWSIARRVSRAAERSHAASDLGNRASDLVQSNFIVWVEGPSDRLYIRHWLSQCAPELIEGAHYSIMFYGGALLSHLSADDEVVDDFIHLLDINRNFTVVIDSDRANESEELNSTKNRVIRELHSIGGEAFVTDGYTIENYVPAAQLEAALADLYPDKKYDVSKDKYKSPLGGTFANVTTRPSKMAVARRITTQNIAWEAWPESLREEVGRIADQIREANHV